MNAAYVDGNCDLGLSHLTGAPCFGHCASVCVDYDRLWKVCSTATWLCHPPLSILFVFLYGVIFALTDRPVVVPRLGALEPMPATRNERNSPLELQAASKDTEIAAETMQLPNLEWRVKMAEVGVSHMLAAIRELKEKLADADVACSTVSHGLPLVESGLETVNVSETLLCEKVAHLQVDNTRLEDQFKIAVFLGDHAHDFL